MSDFALSATFTPVIRLERPADVEAIREIHLSAFPTPVEADLVDRLRADGDLSLSVVVAENGVIGHLAFSPVVIGGGEPVRAYALGPVGVAPDHQSRGLGAAMIRYGLERLQKGGEQLVLLLGDPNYYGRFDFTLETAAGLVSRWSGPHYMGLELNGPIPQLAGRPVRYAAGFEALG